MRLSLTLPGFAAALSVLALSGSALGSDVIDLTESNFKEYAAKPLALIEFFAPWCGHCKALAPEYEKAATELKGATTLAKVDCTVEVKLCEQEGIQGYPTLKVFQNNESTPYNGGRNAPAIVEYMKKQALPSVSKLLNATHTEEFIKSAKVVIVGSFKDTESAAYKIFQKVANALRNDFYFGAVTDPSLTEASKITLHKQFDEGQVHFIQDLKEELLTSFIHSESIPLMDDIGRNNYMTYVKSGLPIAFVFSNSTEQKKAVAAQIEPIAKKFKGKVSFAHIDAVQYAGHAKSLTLNESWPAFAIQNPQKNTRYTFDQSKEITEAAISEFVDNFIAGKVAASLQSAPIPEKNDEPVKVVVGLSFKSLVLDPKKDVLIELYSPQCGYCQRLAPVWEELGVAFKDNQHVVIAKMDGTENELPEDSPWQIEGFPTIKLYKAETNEIVDYDGDRSLGSFLSFLKDHAHHSAHLPAHTEAEAHDEL